MTWSPAARADPAGLEAPRRDETRGALFMSDGARTRRRERAFLTREIPRGAMAGALYYVRRRAALATKTGESAAFLTREIPRGRRPGRSTMFDGAPHSPRGRARTPLFSRARFPGVRHLGARPGQRRSTSLRSTSLSSHAKAPRVPRRPRPTSPASWSPASCCRWPRGARKYKVPRISPPSPPSAPWAQHFAKYSTLVLTFNILRSKIGPRGPTGPVHA